MLNDEDDQDNDDDDYHHHHHYPDGDLGTNGEWVYHFGSWRRCRRNKI